VNCDDDNACTTDICDCHDGCQTLISCDDNDECTDDSCNEQICCENTPVDNDDILVLMMDVQLTLVIMKDVKPLMLTVMITMLVSRVSIPTT